LSESNYLPKPLPVILRAVQDELLSSWLFRHAALYCVTPVVFLRHCVAGLPVNVQTIDYGVTEEAAERLAMHLRREPADIHRMTHADIGNCATHLISRKPIQTCEACRSENRLRGQSDAATRSSRRAWRITCPICGSRLSPASEVPRNETAQTIVQLVDSIWDEALQGERLLESHLTFHGNIATAAVAMLRMLLVPRNGPSDCGQQNVPRPRAIDGLVPGFNDIIAQAEVASAWEKHLIVLYRVSAPDRKASAQILDLVVHNGWGVPAPA